jgi:hypothetical protein
MKFNIKGVSRPTWLGALAVGLLTPLVVWSVVNVNTASIFELDGNAITSGSGDDWDQVASNSNLNATATTFLQDTIPPAADRIFTTGGSKDERDISGGGTVWKHTSGSPPDKNDLEHAFAAAYRDASTDFDLHIYFGVFRGGNLLKGGLTPSLPGLRSADPSGAHSFCQHLPPAVRHTPSVGDRGSGRIQRRSSRLCGLPEFHGFRR